MAILTPTRHRPRSGRNFSARTNRYRLSLLSSTHMLRPQRRLRAPIALSATLAIAALLPVSAGAQSTADALEAAQEQIATLQRDADDLAGRLAEAWDESARLEVAIAEVDARVTVNRRALRALRSTVHERTVEWYTGATSLNAFDEFGGGTVMDSARRDFVRGVIADSDSQTLDRYRAVRGDLADDLAELTSAQASQAQLTEQLAAEGAAIEAKLIEVREREAELEVRFAAELEAQRIEAERIEAERIAAERRAADAAAQADADASGGDGAPTQPDRSIDIDPNDEEPSPVSGNLGVSICPIQGPVSFTDTWGDARSGGRSHEGVDLLSPAGTPNVAVVSGRIEQDYGDRQGNGVFLYGDNGNTYYYFHLSAYEGSERSVSQGEVIGYVGSTGASGANHTHFEIHPGGGSAVNPYPYVRQVC